MPMTRLRTYHQPHRTARWTWVVAVLGFGALQFNLAGHAHQVSELGPGEYHCTICVGPALPQSPSQPTAGVQLAPTVVAFQTGSDAPITQAGRHTADARAPPHS